MKIKTTPHINSKSNKILHILILITIFAESLCEIIVPLQTSIDKKTRFDWSVVLILFSHGFLIDVCMIIIIFFKGHRNYLANHKTTFYFFIFLQIIELYLNPVESFTETRFHSRLILTVTLIFQILIGGFNERSILKKNRGQKITVQKFLHKLLGYVQFLFIKAQLLFTIYHQVSGKRVWFVIPFYLFLNISAYLFFILKSRRNEMRISIKSEYEKTEYKDVLKSLQLNEFNPFENYISSREKTVLENESYFQDKLNPETQWFLFENKVCLMKEFDHSAGNFLIYKCIRRDLTKYLSGENSFPYFCNKSNEVIFFKHKHGDFLKNYIGRYCFGFYSDILFQNVGKSEASVDELGEYGSAMLNATERNESCKQFFDEMSIKDHLIERHLLFDNGVDNLLFVSKPSIVDNSSFQIDLFRYWPAIIGKTLLIDFLKKESGFASFCLSLSPSYRKLRNKYMLKTNQVAFNYQNKYVTKEIIQIDKMIDGSTEKGYSSLCPIFVKSNKSIMTNAIRISNMQGFGLLHLTKLQDRVLILVKNEGIVPFLDFFEMIYQIYLLEVQEDNKEEWIFGREYFLIFGNNVQFTIEWTIDEHFVETSKTIGLYHLQILMEAQKKSIKKRTFPILSSVIINCPFQNLEFYDNLKKEHRVNDKMNVILSKRENMFDKILISGCDNWKTEMFSRFHLEEDLFEKFVFI